MKKLLILLLITPLSLTACNYSEIDNAIDDKIHNKPDEIVSDSMFMDENGNKLRVDIPKDVECDKIIYVGCNGSFSDHYIFTMPDGSSFKEGVEGLNYTINEVSVYESINDSKIKESDCSYSFGGDDTFFEACKYNSFVLVDISAEYTPTELQSDTIQFRMDLTPYYQGGEDFLEFHPSTFINSEDFSSINPALVYFSEQPKEGDCDLNGNPIDLIHSANVCRTPLSVGEKVNFQLGILCSSKLIEDRNLFLINRFSDPVDNQSIYYVDLLGRFIDEKNVDD